MRKKLGGLFFSAMALLKRYHKVMFPALLLALVLFTVLFSVQSYRVLALKRGLCFLQPSCEACSEDR